MGIFIFLIIVAVIVVVVYSKHKKKQELLEIRARYEENLVEESKIAIWGGDGVPPYRNASQPPEVYLKK